MQRDADTDEEICSMPGICRIALNNIVKHIQPIVEIGLNSVLIFGVPSKTSKVKLF